MCQVWKEIYKRWLYKSQMSQVAGWRHLHQLRAATYYIVLMFWGMRRAKRHLIRATGLRWSRLFLVSELSHNKRLSFDTTESPLAWKNVRRCGSRGKKEPAVAERHSYRVCLERMNHSPNDSPQPLSVNNKICCSHKMRVYIFTYFQTPRTWCFFTQLVSVRNAQ